MPPYSPLATALFITLAAPLSASEFTTVDEFQDDFATAKECRPIEGRKVWKGERAFYIQAWAFQTGESGLLDDETASAVPFADNTPEDLADFRKACD